MSKVIKPGNVVTSDQVVYLRDDSPTQLVLDEETAAEQSAADSTRLFDSIVQRAREEGNREAQRLIETAHSACQEIVDGAHAQASAIFEQAKAEGYRAGGELRAGEIDGVMKEIRQTLGRLREELDGFEQEMAMQLADLAIDIAGKVMKLKLQEDDALLTPLVAEAVAEVRNASWISVEISDSLPNLCAGLEKALAEANLPASVNTRDILPENCYIQTPDGVTDISLSTQLENLRELFHR